MNSLYVFLTGRRLITFPPVRGRTGAASPERERPRTYTGVRDRASSSLQARASGRRYGRRSSRPSSSAERLRAVEVEVRLQPVPPALASEAGFLVAAERRRRVEAVVRVGPDHAGLQSLGHPEDARALLG